MRTIIVLPAGAVPAAMMRMKTITNRVLPRAAVHPAAALPAAVQAADVDGSVIRKVMRKPGVTAMIMTMRMIIVLPAAAVPAAMMRMKTIIVPAAAVPAVMMRMKTITIRVLPRAAVHPAAALPAAVRVADVDGSVIRKAMRKPGVTVMIMMTVVAALRAAVLRATKMIVPRVVGVQVIVN
jgi:hypothetical protein